MSMSKNIARLAVTAGLTAALSFGGVMAPVTMAFAEKAGTGYDYVQTVATSGSVTITERTYTDTTFKGIQIFRATVTQGKADADGNGLADENGEWEEGGDKTLSDIEWASEAVKNAVTGAFNSDIDGSPDPKPELRHGPSTLTIIRAAMLTRMLRLLPAVRSTRSPRSLRMPKVLRGPMQPMLTA